MADWRPLQFPLTGGINEEDPQWTLKPGLLTSCRNYECLPGGGYKRVDGYEIYDATTNIAVGFTAVAPHLATYQKLAFSNGGTTVITEGTQISGLTSSCSAQVCGAPEITSGDWALGTAAGFYPVTLVYELSTFAAGETLQTYPGGLAAGTCTAALVPASTEDASYKDWLGGARDAYRATRFSPSSFASAPGAILGGFVLNNKCYAWLKDGTSAALYAAETFGWFPVTLTDYIDYITGIAAINEGDTITGGTSGATATVRRIAIGAGSYAGPTYASGRLAIDTVVGTFQNGEALKVGGVTKATSSSLQTTPTIRATKADGTLAYHQCVVTNFYGASNLTRVYGCNGRDKAYEFDGTYFCGIPTGMVTDSPTFIEAHRNHLFLTFPGGSLQNSGTGLPLSWSPRTGAAEIGIGDEPTGLRSNGNNTLAITASTAVHILTGTSNLDWNLRNITDSIGSVSNTLAEVGGQTLFLDRAGINVVLPAPPTFMDYSTQAISRTIRKTIEAKAGDAIDALHVTKKNQYRLFFSDKTAIVGTFYGTKLAGWAKCVYPHQFTRSWEGVINGVMRVFAGTDEGEVMEMDVGTSFDGQKVESILQFPYFYYGAADRQKRFHKVSLEMETPSAIDLRLSVDFDYGAGGQSANYTTDASATGGIWDTSSWEAFAWDSAVLSSPEINIDGIGKNMGIVIYHNDAVDEPFIVSAALVQYSFWGVKH